MENLILLMISLLILLFMTYYLSGKDILSPPNIMILVFILSTLFTIINAVEWQVTYYFKSYFILITGIVSFVIPYIFISMLKKDNKAVGIVNNYNVAEKRIIYVDKWKIILTVLIDIVIIYFYRKAVYGVVSSSGYSGTNIIWRYKLISGVERTSYVSGYIRLLVKIIDASAYTCVYIFINNVIIYKEKIRYHILLTGPAVIYCVKGLLGGGRQDILKLAAFSFIVSYILNNRKTGWKKNISFKYILFGIIALCVILPSFYYILSLTGRSITRTLFQTLSIYIGGSIEHFNQYIQEPIDKNLFFGNETLTPILNILGDLGIIDYNNTVHLEFRKLGIAQGNVYTFFRRPIQDFGLFGMYIFTILVSGFFSRFYLVGIKHREASLGNDLLIIIYTYLLYWIVLSSVEQYSMTIISVQTFLTLIAIYFCWIFYFCVDLNKHVVVFRKWRTRKQAKV